MNILPKKSWHVRNKDNVEKVRKDEENARLEAKEQSRRAALAEQEARTNFLREKARTRTLESVNDLKSLIQPEDSVGKGIVQASYLDSAKVEAGPSSSMKNEEHEREKKEEQVKYEKKIGLLKYLGEGATESMEDSEKPWYVKLPAKKDCKNEPDGKGLKTKDSLDPIHVMKGHLQKKKLAETNSKKSHKKHKRKHKHHVDEKETLLGGKDKLTKLRQERLKREKKERERISVLLNGGEVDSVQQAQGRYNSQYNPHLVKTRNYSRSRY